MIGASLSRCVLISILVVVSIIPQLATVFALGLANVVLLMILWAVMFLASRRMSKKAYFFVATLFALMMAIPPSPNYIGVSKFGRVFWNPISVDHMFGDPASLAFFFLFYFAIFFASYFLFNNKRDEAINTRP